MIKDFRDIKVWQRAHSLTLKIYSITKSFPKDELYGLTSQIRRASSSVPANLVEGFSRKTKKDSLHFYNIADTSLAELRYHILLSFDLGYINSDKFNKINTDIYEIGKMINGWIRSQS